MLTPVFVLVAGLDSAAAEMTEFRYTGKLKHHERGEEPAVVKEFGLLSIVDQQDDHPSSVFWRVNDPVGWPWFESFGWSVPTRRKIKWFELPGLLYDYDGQPWPIPFPPLHLPEGQRATGKSWTVDRLKYEVQSEAKNFREQPAITVLVTTNFGRAQELLYDTQTGMLQRAQVKLFLGRGDEFSLNIELAESDTLSANSREKVVAGFGASEKHAGSARPR